MCFFLFLMLLKISVSQYHRFPYADCNLIMKFYLYLEGDNLKPIFFLLSMNINICFQLTLTGLLHEKRHILDVFNNYSMLLLKMKFM